MRQPAGSWLPFRVLRRLRKQLPQPEILIGSRLTNGISVSLADSLHCRSLACDLYESLGGRDFCLNLSATFYARVARDPLLRPFFSKSFTCAIEEFAAFLAQFLGGPSGDTQRRWWLSLSESHRRFKIGPRERAAWLGLMIATLEEIEIPESDRSALRALFEQSSAYIVNQGSTASNASIPNQDVADRWKVQLALDQVVGALRGGDPGRTLDFAASPPLSEFLSRDQTVHAHLLALFIQDGHAELIAYVEKCLAARPSLALVRYSIERTLLNCAAGSGNLSIVRQLLSLGADPNAGRHSPLYSLANECTFRSSLGVEIVRALTTAGADVNARDATQETTPLHMAARRGSSAIAGALLDCGAEIDPRDRKGETPLRRAVNCNRYETAGLLLSRGAGLHSPNRTGSTPLTAARNAKMRGVLESVSHASGPVD